MRNVGHPRTTAIRWGLAGGALALLLSPALQAQSDDGRIVTPEEVERAAKPAGLLPLRIISWPHRRVAAGMEKGLISVEKRKLRERYQQWIEHLRSHGIEARFGGTGEGTGLGGGGVYTLPLGAGNTLRFLGLGTFKGYQEFDVRWEGGLEHSRLTAAISYQWRPQENFYGLGHGSLAEKHSNFALRQTWAGVHYEVVAKKRLRWGALYRQAWISALAGQNPSYSPPPVFFAHLPGYGEQVRLHSVGSYIEADGLRGEYALGGAAHWGASYQKGLGRRNLEYWTSEIQIEGRLPVVPSNSVLVGQADFEIDREVSGSDPIPFYLLPHIGGSSTLRGFALDRFYGKGVALLSLEYRYRIHPNIQAVPFFDEGQIFDRTSDLAWLNWHRNYGLGFRFRTALGTFLRVEYGHSKEGFQLHLTFGDRARPPLRGPIRYGAYKR